MLGVLLLWEREVTHGFGVFLRKSFFLGGGIPWLADRQERMQTAVRLKKKKPGFLSNRLAEDVRTRSV